MPLCDSADLERVGQTVGGYALGQILGVGGMGVVYRARHLALGKQVAIKILNERFVHRQDAAQEMLREAQAASRIRHPNIVDITDYGTTADGAAFFVMELLEGQSLGQTLLREKRLEARFACAIAWQIASALQAAHDAGIIHRDLKPENVFLLNESAAIPRGSCERVKLLDFGLAKVLDMEPSSRTRAGLLAGTPWYMSPEQARNRPLDGRSDLYALGVLLYLMLTGELPFTGPSPMEILMAHLSVEPTPPAVCCPEVDEVLEGIVLRCLRKEPEARFEQMGALAAALEVWLAQRPGLERVAQKPLSTVPQEIFSPTAPLPQPAASQHTVTSELMDQVLGPQGLALRAELERLDTPELLLPPPRQADSAPAPSPALPESAPAAAKPTRLWWVLAAALSLGALTIALVLGPRSPDSAGVQPAVSLETAPQAAQTPAERPAGSPWAPPRQQELPPALAEEASEVSPDPPDPAPPPVSKKPQTARRTSRAARSPRQLSFSHEQRAAQRREAAAREEISPSTPAPPALKMEARQQETTAQVKTEPDAPPAREEPRGRRYRSWVLDPFSSGR